jgi:outer membrane lipoprotein-sorting protein
MMKTILAIFISMTICVFCYAQTADEIVNKHIEAEGGLDKLKGLQSMRVTGKLTAHGGLEAPYVVVKKRPDKLRMEFIVQGLTGITAYDGQTGWSLMPFMGSKDPQKMTEDQTKDMVEEADFDGPLVDYKQKGHTVEYMGKEDVEGTECHKLKLTLKDGRVRYMYFDPESFLLVKTTSMIKREGVEESVDTFFADYKEVNGLMFPHFIENKSKQGPSQQYTSDKFELNVDVADSVFTMPAASQSQPTQ